MRDQSSRAVQIRAFEEEAEALATYQFDLLAHLERQIRAVHHTMRHIEKLRSLQHRVGPALSNGQREETLDHLADEVMDFDAHITTEHECCVDMQSTIAHMRERISRLCVRVAGSNRTADGSQSQASE